MKIALIGPLPPVRGGISHSNSILLSNLEKEHKVLPVSFSRLFPKILYPGKAQEGNPGKYAVLDSLNPKSWKTAADKINEFKPDVMIFQWWTTFLFPCYSYLAGGISAKKIAICQNVFPHSEGAFKFLADPVHREAAKMFLSKMNRLVAMSNADRKIISGIFAKKETGLYIEPPYAMQGLGKMPKEVAKKQLGLPGRNVLLFFGFVREYKGLRYLLEAMPKIIEQTNAQLLIVGEFWQDKKNYGQMIEKLGIGKNITIVDRYVADGEIPAYFSAADAVVLPYISISESGVISMAFNFGTPVISTDVGGNPDNIENEVNGFLVPPKDSAALAKKTIGFFKKNLYEKMQKGMEKKKAKLQWSKEKETEILGA